MVNSIDELNGNNTPAADGLDGNSAAADVLSEADVLSDADRQELGQNLRQFLAETAGERELREHINLPGGYDPALWSRLATEVGAQGLALPAECGGAGYGLQELQLVQEELGRVVYAGPFFATVVLAARLLGRVFEGVDPHTSTPNPTPQSASQPPQVPQAVRQQARDWLTAIAAGELTATLAYREGAGEFEPGQQLATEAAPLAGALGAAPSGAATDLAVVDSNTNADTANYAITGSKNFVLNGDSAELILVVAELEGASAIFALPREAAGVTVTSLNTLDHTRPLSRVDFAGAPATLLLAGSVADEVLASVLEEAGVLLAAEQVAGAARLLEMTVQYTSERYQFGRPVGSFQAVKHQAANMLLELETARAIVNEAVARLQAGASAGADAAVSSSAADAGSVAEAGATAALGSASALSSASAPGAADAADPTKNLRALAAAAAYQASTTYVFAAETAIQLHGGMGVTWEHAAHFYLKRAKSTEVLLRSPRQRVQDIVAALGL